MKILFEETLQNFILLKETAITFETLPILYKDPRGDTNNTKLHKTKLR